MPETPQVLPNTVRPRIRAIAGNTRFDLVRVLCEDKPPAAPWVGGQYEAMAREIEDALTAIYLKYREQ